MTFKELTSSNKKMKDPNYYLPFEQVRIGESEQNRHFEGPFLCCDRNFKNRSPKTKSKSTNLLKQIFMEKKTITITASAAIINTITLILAPASTQRILSESFYLGTIKQTVTLWLS
jgi:hypothetical protein